MHGSSKLPEMYLYVGQGYFKDFSSCIQKYFGDKVHYVLSSDFSMESNLDSGDPTNLEAMLGHKGEEISDDDKPIYTWYCSETRDSSSVSAQSSDKDTSPNSNSSQFTFKLGMYLVYHDVKGNKIVVVYGGASAKCLLHTICLEDGTKLDVHDSNLHLINQPDISNIPKNSSLLSK